MCKSVSGVSIRETPVFEWAVLFGGNIFEISPGISASPWHIFLPGTIILHLLSGIPETITPLVPLSV